VSLESSLFAKLAPRRFERCLTGLDLAPDRKPRLKSPVSHEQDRPFVSAEDRNGKRAARRHGEPMDTTARGDAAVRQENGGAIVRSGENVR
jgi:hypothetical protein